MDKVELARRWADHTVIITILFQTELKDGVCDLVLDLATSEKPGSKAISIRFAGISNLTLSEIGGGISQFCRLEVADIRNQQWDRLNYKVWDCETERIEFMCRDFEIEREYCT
jgi:hypothetical protein